jgi:hypothetical protein
MNLIQANNELLKEIQRRLALDDKTPEMFGFKSPTGVNTELQRELLQYDPHLELQKFESLQAEYPNNQDQQRVFDAILEAAHVGMRLSINQHDTIALTPHLLRQHQYADSILAIGEGRYDDYAIILDTDFSGSIMKVGLAQMKCFFKVMCI